MKPILLLVLAAISLAAQTPRAQGHAFFGFDNPPGANFDYSSAGAGFDLFVYKGLAVSPSAGYLFNHAERNRGAAVVTLNGSYHFLRGEGKFQPFVTAGYGALANFTDGQAMFNYGGGANYWLHKHLGFRAEVLNFQSSSYRELTSIRIGISFR
jgi:hypothetical protein